MTDEPPRTRYQCPQCEMMTRKPYVMQVHWRHEHADDHGPFAEIDLADIEVTNGDG